MASGSKWEVIDVAITCTMCGTANGDGVKFCSACGSELGGGNEKASSPSKPKPGRAKTMLMGTSPVASVSRDKPKPTGAGAGRPSGLESTVPGKKGGAAKTALGMAAVTGQTSANQGQAAPKPAQKSPVAKKPAPSPNKTMLGVASPVATAKTPSNAPASAKPKGTGVPMAKAVPVATAKPAAKSDPAPAPKSTPMAKQTMLGMPALGDTSSVPPSGREEAPKGDDRIPPEEMTLPLEPPPADPEPPAETAAVDAAEPEEAPVDAPVSHATEPMEALQEPASPAPAAGAGSTQPISASAQRVDTFNSWPDERASAEPKRGGLIIALVLIVVVILGVGGTLGYMMLFSRDLKVNPQVFPSPDGQSIIVSLPLPEAPPGTTVAFGQQVVPVAGGGAQVTIPMSQLKLGNNEIALSYTEPSKSPVPLSFPVVLRHSITDDFTGLAADPPMVSVVFRVAPSVSLAVEGKPVPVAQGSFVHQIPLDKIMASAKPGQKQILYSVPFQLTDQNGVTEQGQHAVAVPVVELQVDRPADNALIQADAVTCSGTTEPGAQVTVNGSPVGVTATGFSTTVPLPTFGEHPISVTARMAGKAPNTQTLTVKRIESFDAAIAEWSTDLDKSLDYPTIGRDPNAYTGKKVKLNGRVVNISTEKGVTAFILYVGEGCPARGKCAVYVVLRGETDAGLQSWVDVYGTVRGTRSVDLQQGLKIEVPAVDAAFVIKSEKNKKKSRRKKK